MLDTANAVSLALDVFTLLLRVWSLPLKKKHLDANDYLILLALVWSPGEKSVLSLSHTEQLLSTGMVASIVTG